MIELFLKAFRSWFQPKQSKLPSAGLGLPGDDGVWPVRQFDGHRPVVSDGFGRPGPKGKRGGRGHLGVDVMFRRKKSGDFLLPEYTRHFFCPSDKVVAQNVFPGRVWSARFDKNHGWAVKIDHGGSHLTVHRHLSEVVVKKGDDLVMGQTIGFVGHAPSAGRNGVNHNHFEIWDTSREGKKSSRARMAIDPKPWMDGWRRF